MKLGTQTGSMTNHILARATRGQPDPEVGMGVTILCWTDRHAGTIRAILPNGDIEVTSDRATLVKGSWLSEDQEYRYETIENAHPQRWRFKDGIWREVCQGDDGRWRLTAKGQGSGLRIGERSEYRDPSF